MATDIIQHHEPFDFVSFFDNIGAQYAGIDRNDLSSFMQMPGEKHSFMGSAEGHDRVKRAILNAIGTKEAGRLISEASSVMIVLQHSQKAELPVAVREMQCLNDLIKSFPEGCDVVWCVSNDISLSNTIRIIVLINKHQ